MTGAPSSSCTYAAAPQRVVLGAGTSATVGEELRRLGLARAAVISTPGQRALAVRIEAALGALSVGILDGAKVHVPAAVARDAVTQARRLEADSLVAVGGGSAIGLAKAMALEAGWTIVALPTTYAGSEATAIYGITEAHTKVTARDARVLPATVVYDADLSASLPLALSVASGLNGMAHAVEALYAPDGNPVTDALAGQGLRLFTRGLGALVNGDSTSAVRSELLWAAWLCGHVLGQTSMGLHHKLCHVLGGRFNLPHAELHALMLPHVLDLTATRRQDLIGSLAQTMGVADPIAWLRQMHAAAGLPTSLQALGVPVRELDGVAAFVASAPHAQSFPIEQQDVATLLHAAAGPAAASAGAPDG